MTSIETLTRLLGLAFVSGVNLYATILMVGLGIRYHWVSGLPPELTVLAHPAVLVAAAILYLLEFLADKIPFVSALWDAIHTVIRPLGGALLALAAVSGHHVNPVLQVLAFLVGGTVALGSHSAKMGVRLLAHTAPEPVMHSGISVLEDVGVVGLLIFGYRHPLAGLVVILGLICAVAWVGPTAFRIVRFLLRGVYGRLVFWRGANPAVPAWLERALAKSAGKPDARVYLSYARSVEKVPTMKHGYLIRGALGYTFAYKGLFRPVMRSLGPRKPDEFSVRPGWIFDVLAIGAQNTIYLTKDQAARFQTETEA